MFSLKKYLPIVALLAGFICIFFYDIIFLGKTFKISTASAQAMLFGAYGQENNKPKFIPVNGTDSAIMEEPVLEFMRNSFRRGIIPLWNPHQACGYPQIAMLEAGMFFPLNFIMYLLPQPYSWDILILARFLLGGFFVFLFMQQLGFKRTPSIASAIAYMFMGPMILLQYWIANVEILAPLLLLVLDRLAKKSDLKNLSLTALVVGMTFFAGHPEHIFLVNVYGFAFFCYRIFSLPKPKNIKQTSFFLIISYSLGILLSSVVLWPFLQNLNSELWHGHPDFVGLRNEEIRERIITLALPHFFQKEPLTFDFTFSGWWGGYLGTIPLMLAFLSLFSRQKRGLNFFFAITAFLFVSKAYGFWYINWVGYLPIFSICRYAIHTPHLVALSVAILVRMGVRSIQIQTKNFSRAMFFSISTLLLAAIYLFINRSNESFSLAIKATIFAAVVLIIFQTIVFLKDKKLINQKIFSLAIVVILSLELFSYIHRGWVKRYDSFPKVPYIEFLREQSMLGRSYGFFGPLYPNTATGFGLDDLGTFNSLLQKRYVNFINTFIKPNNFKNDLRPPALRALPLTQGVEFIDLLNVRYIITPETQRLKRLLPGMDRIAWLNYPNYSQEVNIYTRGSTFPRSFIVHQATFEPNDDVSLKKLDTMRDALRTVALINDELDPTIMVELSKISEKETTDSSEIIRYTPNEVEINAKLSHPGFLILSDSYHPDWQVFVDGKKSKLFRADYMLRGVFLNSGEHHVKFIFAPRSFYWGAVISAVTLLIILGLLLRAKITDARR